MLSTIPHYFGVFMQKITTSGLTQLHTHLLIQKPEIGHFGRKMKFVLSPPEGSLTTLVH